MGLYLNHILQSRHRFSDWTICCVGYIGCQLPCHLSDVVVTRMLLKFYSL